ncbi:hypothetical protein, partial [Bacteroides heparinolyticus]|uniref:hypothetical protein n=1 Tax=Prevotella heparinolytica TaxID=28113 RepID=UPI00359FFEBC
DVINKESWWNAQSAIPNKVITRIFPINGEVRGSTLYNMGQNTFYQSSSNYYSSGAWQVSITQNYAFMRFDYDFNINSKSCPVRLFSAE